MNERLVIIRWGNWKFENWHFYKLTEHQTASGKTKFKKWDKVL